MSLGATRSRGNFASLAMSATNVPDKSMPSAAPLFRPNPNIGGINLGNESIKYKLAGDFEQKTKLTNVNEIRNSQPKIEQFAVSDKTRMTM